MGWKRWFKENMTISKAIDLIVWHGVIGFMIYIFYFVASYEVTWQIPAAIIVGYFIGLYKIFQEEESQTKKFIVEVKEV